jgi:integrase/recombinase XerD
LAPRLLSAHVISLHLLRVSALNTIRAWLGHVSLDTTNIYAETDLEMKAKALACCEVKEVRQQKRWSKNIGLMTFLQSL